MTVASERVPALGWRGRVLGDKPIAGVVVRRVGGEMVHPRGTARGANVPARPRLNPGHAGRDRGCRTWHAGVAAPCGHGEEFVENAHGRQGTGSPAAGPCSGTCQPSPRGLTLLWAREPDSAGHNRSRTIPNVKARHQGWCWQPAGKGVPLTVEGRSWAWFLSAVPWAGFKDLDWQANSCRTPC